MEDNAQRFLSAFVQIEKKLRLIAGETRYEKFYRLLEAAAKQNKIVRRYEFNLQEYADLRNAIVHQRDGVGQVIAQPTDEVVQEIEEVLSLLTQTPPVSKYFLKKIDYCKKEDKILKVHQIMHQKGYSKIPVVERDMIVGLLHIEDIAAWACGKLQGEIRKENVESLMDNVQGKRNVLFISKDTNVYDIPSYFTQGLKKGSKLDAIFITETGSKKQKAIGIITVKDLPLILECF